MIYSLVVYKVFWLYQIVLLFIPLKGVIIYLKNTFILAFSSVRNFLIVLEEMLESG
jgi:hypothetical protein